MDLLVFSRDSKEHIGMYLDTKLLVETATDDEEEINAYVIYRDDTHCVRHELASTVYVVDPEEIVEDGDADVE